jgi:hypothetical protein
VEKSMITITLSLFRVWRALGTALVRVAKPVRDLASTESVDRNGAIQTVRRVARRRVTVKSQVTVKAKAKTKAKAEAEDLAAVKAAGRAIRAEVKAEVAAHKAAMQAAKDMTRDD